jgi:hypothetical protein
MRRADEAAEALYACFRFAKGEPLENVVYTG